MERPPGIIDVNVSVRQNRFSLYKAVIQAGKCIGANAIKSLYAWYAACRSSRRRQTADLNLNMLRVAVIGHPYIIEDRQASLGIIDKISNLGIAAYTADMVPRKAADSAAQTIGKRLYWTHGRQLLGASLSFMDQASPVDGVIFMTSFSCGLDSLIGEIIKQQAQRRNIPFLLLSIDEHTAEAGIITRIEAFTDMLKRRGSI